MAFALVALAGIAFSTQGTGGIALNHDTKECGYLWGGDEYFNYELPAGWKAYSSHGNGSIVTESGSCRYNYSDLKSCCDQLGYTYVSGNVGKQTFRGPEGLGWWLLNMYGSSGLLIILVLAALATIVLGLLVWNFSRKRKK